MPEVDDRKPWANQSPELREKTKMVAVRLPISLIDSVAKIAKTDKSTKAAVMRHALQQFIDANARTPKVASKSGLFP